MRNWQTLLIALLTLVVSATTVFGTPTYRSFIEWNGPYYNVRHGLTADSNGYVDYQVNSPLPLYSTPFSSPTAVELFGSVDAMRTFVVDHDHRRVQVFATPAKWNVEALLYSATPVQGNYGGRSVKFSLGEALPNSERIWVNGKFFKRVGSLTGYGATDSVYTMVYSGVPNTGGVATLPLGWDLLPTDSVRVEYSYATPPGTPGAGEVDYILYQSTPTDIPLQLNEATSTTDPAMTDLSSLALNPSVRSGAVVDLYLVNALTGGSGSLASYDLTNIGTSGAFSHVDTYPGMIGRPYDVEVVDRGTNVDGTVAEGTPSGAANSTLTESITNQNTFLGNDYRITFSFDTSTTMNASATPAVTEVDLLWDASRGRLHMVMTSDNASPGTAYSYSDDWGQSWSTPLTISAATLTGVHDRPRIAMESNGNLHVVFEAVDGGGDRHLYHTISADGLSWSANVELTTTLTPSTVAANRYANLLVDPSDNVHLVWAGDDDVYYRVYNGSWGAASLIASGGGTGFSAPHCVIDNIGRIYMAYVSDAAAPADISYMLFNGATWGSYQTGGFTSATPDPVTTAAGFVADGGGRGEAFPLPQIVMVNSSLYIFWAGTGTETYGVDQAQLRYNMISSLDGNFTSGAGTAITTGDDVAPMAFSVAVDPNDVLHILYPYGTTVDREGLRYKTYDTGSSTWSPVVGSTGREILEAGAAATVYAMEPRLTCPEIAGQTAPFMVCAKAYTSMGAGSPRGLFKVIDGVVTITDQTALAEVQTWRVWTNNTADAAGIPGLTFTIANTADFVSSTDNVDATNFNVGDYYELDGTAASKNDLLFISDSDEHRVKVIRAYENIDNCFAGDTRWDVPGQSDGTPGQTFKLATIGGEDSYTVWASPDNIPWTIVEDLLIAGPADRYCEVDRYTRELRFGDGAHGLIPPSGTFVRVTYEESVDEAEFGTLGSASGQLSYPRGIAVAYNDNLDLYDVYVCDTGNDRLQKFSYNPAANVNPESWTSPKVAWSTVSGATDFLSAPEDIETIILNGEVYLVVSDNGNDRVVIYKDTEATGSGGNAAPMFVAQTGSTGNTLNRFTNPKGLGVMAEDSGLVILAADADRDKIMKIVSRDWLTEFGSDSTGGVDSSSIVPELAIVDGLDGDGYLLLQPGAVRTLRLELNNPDSLVSVRAACTFPASMISVLNISEGNLWSGERFTNTVFLTDVDNTAGTFDINAAMVGDDDGLSLTGTRIAATITVQALTTVTIPSTGAISFAATTDLRAVGNVAVTNGVRSGMSLRAGYLADIATTGGSPGNAPNMVPEPDGQINFADVNIFTQGWNGDGLTFDPIADIGPYLGSDVPDLIANPDGRLDAYDLLSLATMYAWYNSSGASAFSGRDLEGDNLDDDGAILVSYQPNGESTTLTISVPGASELTSAHLVIDVLNPHAVIASVAEGDFLRRGAQTIFLSHHDGTRADVNIGRLSRTTPGISGSGTLASLEITVPEGELPLVRVRYELRDSENNLTGFGVTQNVNELLPGEFGLKPAYPNPFNPSTNITFVLPEAADVSLRAYNLLGQEVATLLQGRMEAGEHTMIWNAENSQSVLPTGVYFLRLDALERSSLQKVILMR
ncbi:MAG: T9SS type A sorting domain-containing protein [Calditrichaeota bacterium]|nr:T9SS type A sorting domain-containing protein [Calditrichota bacterium]